MKHLLSAILLFILLTGSAFAASINTENYDEYNAQAKEEMRASFSERNAVRQSFGLPDSYCPNEVRSTADHAITDIKEAAAASKELADLNIAFKQSGHISLSGGYQDLSFSSKEAILTSDGASLIDISDVRTIWYFILYVDDKPSQIVTVVKSPSNPQYHYSGLFPGGENTARALTAFESQTSGIRKKSPVFLSMMGNGECIVTADTAEGEKALVSYEENSKLYNVKYIIGFEQERIKSLENDLNRQSDQGVKISYANFKPIEAISGLHHGKPFAIVTLGFFFTVLFISAALYWRNKKPA